MKRIFTLLLLILTAFTLKTTAQNTACTPAFTSSTSGFAVHFTPSVTGDPGIATHTWKFGDGSTSNDISPTHTYANCGSFTVWHILKRAQSGTVAPCADSTSHVVTLTCTTTCTVHAAFSSAPNPSQINKIDFTNQSTPANDITQTYWSFGDGTSSNDWNVSHVYTSAGTYTVCLQVKHTGTNGGPTCESYVCKAIQVTLPTPLPCTLHSSFSWASDASQSNKINFSNLSTPVGDVNVSRWSFGDGTYSYDFNASHVYTTAGTYTVCLFVKKNTAAGLVLCQDEKCLTIQVVIPPPPPCDIHAKFSWAPDQSQSNKIIFTNQSTPTGSITETKWYFGDGTYGNDFNASHVYPNGGTYTVCLIVKKLSPAGAILCQDDTCIGIHVTVPVLCNLVANFSWAPEPNQINNINFTNLSYPLSSTDSIRWTFGDGGTSTSTNASHIYTTAGTYHVCLRVKKNGNTVGTAPCVKEICKDIVVYTQCNLIAGFTSEANSQNSLQINFHNSSTPASAATTVSWSFGDGTSSNQWSPSHTYTHGGTYTVCLHVSSGTNCVREICKSVVVIEPINCNEISKFDTIHSTANCLEFKFEPGTKNTTYQYFWTFGDGTSSTTMIPSHVYAAPGNYNVCLTVIRSATCASTTCKTVHTGLCFSCNNVWAKYSYVRDPANASKLYFHAFSNYPILTQTWTITKISPASSAPPVVLNTVDPVYTFPEPGYYRVCLKAVTYGNCIKEYCEVIYIGAPPTTCVLSAYPNPATTQINVNVVLTAPEMIHAYVYNSLNVVVKEKHQQGNTGNNVINFELTGLVPGNYTIKLIYGNSVCYAQFQKL